MVKADSTATKLRSAQSALGLSTSPLKRPAKVGTQPWTIILKGGCRPVVGRTLTFRRAEDGGKWTTGKVTQINADGYLFIDLI